MAHRPPGGVADQLGVEQQLASKLSTFRPLSTSQLSFLRSLFLSFSDRPADQAHVHDFIRRQYRDIPSESRGALGRGVLELFRGEERLEEERRAELASALARGDNAPSQKRKSKPKVTWKSFHRVCAALGLHLSERRGQAAIRKLCIDGGEPAAPSPNAEAGALAAAITEPGMSFDDFMIFYAQLSRPLSLAQEMREVWRLLDEDLSGQVPLKVIRTAMVGLEHIAPSNTKEHSTFFYESNYRYHYTEQEKQLSSEDLIDQMLRSHFVDKVIDQDRINFQEFVEFLYA